MAVTTAYLGTHDGEVWLDEALGTEGDLGGILTIDSETMTVVSGLGTERILVARGTDGATHDIGSTVTLSGVLEIDSSSAAATALTFKVSTAVGGYDQLIDATDAELVATSGRVTLAKFKDSDGTTRYLTVSSGGTVAAGTAA